MVIKFERSKNLEKMWYRSLRSELSSTYAKFKRHRYITVDVCTVWMYTVYVSFSFFFLPKSSYTLR